MCPSCSSPNGLGIDYLIGSKVRYLNDNPDDFDYVSPDKRVLVVGHLCGQWPVSRPLCDLDARPIDGPRDWSRNRRAMDRGEDTNPRRPAPLEVPAHPFPPVRHVSGLRRIPFSGKLQAEAIDGNTIVYWKTTAKQAPLYLATISRTKVRSSRQIPDSDNSTNAVGLSRRWVVWETAATGHNRDTLFAYDRQSGQSHGLNVTTHPEAWSMSGDELIAAWKGSVRLVNLDSGTWQQIARVPSACDPIQPAVSGSEVGFSESIPPLCTSGEIVGMDLTTHQIASAPIAAGESRRRRHRRRTRPCHVDPEADHTQRHARSSNNAQAQAGLSRYGLPPAERSAPRAAIPTGIRVAWVVHTDELTTARRALTSGRR